MYVKKCVSMFVTFITKNICAYIAHKKAFDKIQ